MFFSWENTLLGKPLECVWQVWSCIFSNMPCIITQVLEGRTVGILCSSLLQRNKRLGPLGSEHVCKGPVLKPIKNMSVETRTLFYQHTFGNLYEPVADLSRLPVLLTFNAWTQTEKNSSDIKSENEFFCLTPFLTLSPPFYQGLSNAIQQCGIAELHLWALLVFPPSVNWDYYNNYWNSFPRTPLLVAESTVFWVP